MSENDLPVPGPMSRRRFIAAAGIAGAAAALPLGAGAAHASTSTTGTAPSTLGSNPLAAFVKPDPRTAARFRWWWPCGNVEEGEIAREVDQVADAGFGGLEIADVHHSMSSSNLDPERHGWATAPWIAAAKAALRQAHRRGITIDLSIGPSWPAAVPTVGPDSPAAATELAHGLVALTGGTAYDGDVPPPAHDADGATEKTFIGLHATKVVAPPSRPGQPEVMDPDSWVDLTDTITDGTIAWTPPDSGDWVLLSYWQRGSGQKPEAGPHTTPDAYVVDHFSRAGTDAVTSFWEQNILDSEMRSLIRKAGNTLFEDSLEIETDATLWTPGFLDEFERRIGYDLRPYLPIIVEYNEKYLYMYDSTLSNQVRDDAAQVLSDLYNENHLLPLRSWAHDLGLQLRVQGYGLETDSVYQAALFDQPESESLGFKNLDDYRALSGGRDMGGNTILSCEAAAYANGAYNTTWFKVLNTLGSIYAGGVNQAVLHGFSYADAPGAAWPGFAAFSPYNNGKNIGYGESWGPRMPMWTHARDVADHLARTQGVLQTGVNRADLAFFRQKGWTATGIGVGWGTSAGIPIGWSYGYLSAPLLELDSAYVEDGRLAPEGPGYQAVVIEGDRFRGKAPTMQVEAARALDKLSRRGLRLVFLGDWSEAGGTGLPAAGEDDQVNALVSDMLARPTTANAPTENDMPAALEQLGVQRAVEHESSTIMHVHRHLPGGRGRGNAGADLYYVANARHAENRRINRVDQDVWFTASSSDAVPYQLNTWTGEVTEIAQYVQDGRRFRVRVGLEPAESVVIAFTEPANGNGRKFEAVVATEADAVRRVTKGVALRASAAGTYATSFADGRTARTAVDAVPEPVGLAAWDLRAESWGPGATADSMKKTDIDVHLDALAPWPEVAGLEDASGVGRYRTTVTLDASWRDVGAYLDLGTVFDTFRVTVNGRRISPQTPLVTRVDLGDALQVGKNVIEVEAPTTLFNRLRVESPAVFGSSARQSYGLVGPVAITPYREVLVTR